MGLASDIFGGGSGGGMLERMGVELAFKDKFSAGMANYERKLVGLGAKASGVARSMNVNWDRVATGVSMAGAAVVAAGALAVNESVKFHHGASRVKTMMIDASEAQKDAVLGAAREMSVGYGRAVDDMLNAEYDLLSAGVAAGEVPEALEIASKAAVAGFVDVSTATSIGLTSINAYGEGVENLADNYDVMFRTVEKGRVTMEQLSAEWGKVLPHAAKYGVALEHVGASTAVMTKQGLSAAESMTSLKALILGIYTPTESQAKAFREVGGEAFEAAKATGDLVGAISALAASPHAEERLSELFPNTEEMVAFNMLTTNAGELESVLRDLEDSAGATRRALDIAKDDPAQQIEELKAAYKDLTIEVGDALLPALQQITPAIKKNVTAISAFAAEHPGVTKVGMALGSVALMARPLREVWKVGAGIAKALGKAGIAANFLKGKLSDVVALVSSRSVLSVLGVVGGGIIATTEKAGEGATGIFDELGSEDRSSVAEEIKRLSAKTGFSRGMVMERQALLSEAKKAFEGTDIKAQSEIAEKLGYLTRDEHGFEKYKAGLSRWDEPKTTGVGAQINIDLAAADLIMDRVGITKDGKKKSLEEEVADDLGTDIPNMTTPVGGGGGGGPGPALSASVGGGLRTLIAHFEKGSIVINSNDPSLKPAVRQAFDEVLDDLGFAEGG